MKHTLKSYDQYFAATVAGQKRHEYRDKIEGPFAVGDLIVLNEYDRKAQMYTGRTCSVVVTYISPDASWIPATKTMMSIKLVGWWKFWQ